MDYAGYSKLRLLTSATFDVLSRIELGLAGISLWCAVLAWRMPSWVLSTRLCHWASIAMAVGVILQALVLVAEQRANMSATSNLMRSAEKKALDDKGRRKGFRDFNGGTKSRGPSKRELLRLLQSGPQRPS
ncbi:MAG: hypothetical protein ACYCWW_00100 [Deltaproteobacteria bacterium]